MRSEWFLTDDSIGDQHFGPSYSFYFSKENGEIDWAGRLKDISLEDWYASFHAGVRAASSLGDCYYRYLALFIKDYVAYIWDEVTYYFIFADVCSRLAESKSDVEQQRNYLTEALTHCQKAIKVGTEKEYEKTYFKPDALPADTLHAKHRRKASHPS